MSFSTDEKMLIIQVLELSPESYGAVSTACTNLIEIDAAAGTQFADRVSTLLSELESAIAPSALTASTEKAALKSLQIEGEYTVSYQDGVVSRESDRALATKKKELAKLLGLEIKQGVLTSTIVSNLASF